MLGYYQNNNNDVAFACIVSFASFVWMVIVWLNLSNLNDKMRELVALKKASMGLEPERVVTMKSLAELAANKTGRAAGTVASKLSGSPKKEGHVSNQRQDDTSPAVAGDAGVFNPNLIHCVRCGGANARGHTLCLSCGHGLV